MRAVLLVRICGALALLAVAVSCYSGLPGGTGGESGGGTDGIPCPHTCAQASDCCLGTQYPTAPELAGLACPGSRFPNNWQCVGGTCVQQTDQGAAHPGCTSHDQCGPACVPGQDPGCIVPEYPWKCFVIDGVGFCADDCVNDGDCENNDEPNPVNRTHCRGLADGGAKYCVPG